MNCIKIDNNILNKILIKYTMNNLNTIFEKNKKTISKNYLYQNGIIV